MPAPVRNLQLDQEKNFRHKLYVNLKGIVLLNQHVLYKNGRAKEKKQRPVKVQFLCNSKEELKMVEVLKFC